MGPVAAPVLNLRGLSIDNTINIIFGVLTSVLGLFSVALAWAMWKSSRWSVGRGSQEDCKWFPLGCLASANKSQSCHATSNFNQSQEIIESTSRSWRKGFIYDWKESIVQQYRRNLESFGVINVSSWCSCSRPLAWKTFESFANLRLYRPTRRKCDEILMNLTP